MDYRLTSQLLAFLALAVPVGAARAQEPYPSREPRIDLAGGVGADRFAGSLAFSHHFGLAVNRRARVGYGVRYSYFSGDNLRYRTADKDELNGGPTDHARVAESAIHSVNLVFHLDFQASRRIELGFNIDVIGVGFGPERALASENLGDPALAGRPTGFNLLQGGVNDRGTLNSEFYLGWRAGARTILRAGISHFVAEYESETPLQNGSTRLRVDGNLGFVAVGVTY